MAMRESRGVRSRHRRGSAGRYRLSGRQLDHLNRREIAEICQVAREASYFMRRRRRAAETNLYRPTLARGHRHRIAESRATFERRARIFPRARNLRRYKSLCASVVL